MLSSITTSTGRFVDLLHPKPEMVAIEDIAHALSKINRFTGHTSRPYTVADHCLLASYMGIGGRLACLLHDAAEAYLGDVASPLKRNTLISVDGEYVPFKELERAHLSAIGTALGCDTETIHSGGVALTDKLLLVAEASVLLGVHSQQEGWAEWFTVVSDHKDLLMQTVQSLRRWLDRGLTQTQVEKMYLGRYEELKND